MCGWAMRAGTDIPEGTWTGTFQIRPTGNSGRTERLAVNIYQEQLGRNTCSKSIHSKFTSSSSWHEIGVYDIPAMIDHIINATKQKKIFYIGHSQGGTSFFAMASELPEYQKKLVAAFTLAPAVFMSRTRHLLIRMLVPFQNNIKVEF